MKSWFAEYPLRLLIAALLLLSGLPAQAGFNAGVTVTRKSSTTASTWDTFLSMEPWYVVVFPVQPTSKSSSSSSLT